MSAQSGVPPGSSGPPARSITVPAALARSIADLSRDGICSVDVAGIVRFANHRLAEMLGHTEEALIGQPARDLVDPASWPILERYLSNAQPKPPQRIDLVLRHRSGRAVPTST